MPSIERQVEDSSALEKATSAFFHMTGLALKKSVTSDWSPMGDEGPYTPNPNLLMRHTNASFTRIVPARYALIAYSPHAVDGRLPPMISLGEAAGRACQRLRIARTDVAPYTPDFEQGVPSLLERRFHIQLSTESWEKPAFSKPRALTEAEALSFEPYGGPTYEIALTDEPHTAWAEYMVGEEEDSLWMTQMLNNGNDGRSVMSLRTNEDAPPLIELNKLLYDAIKNWR